ncbi:hypothetical protein N9713_02965 [Candidatus Pelagibacter sp.]|nr:hypothetical protein [Candidatus Pelagibacter sp.]
MNGSIGAALIGWGILIAFLVIRHFVRKKDYSDVSHQQKVIDEIVRKRKTPAPNGPLVYKGTKEAFEYIKKFIETQPLKKGSAYYGVLGSKASMAQIHCTVKGKPEIMMVWIDAKKCKSEIKEDDLVLVGVDDVRKGLTLKKAISIIEVKDSAPQTMANALMTIRRAASIGTVLQKVKPEMNSKTMQFDIYDD